MFLRIKKLVSVCLVGLIFASFFMLTGCAAFSETFSIHYHLDGGANYNGAPDCFTRNSEISLQAPTKIGFAFEGWYLDDFSTKIEKIERGTKNDISLFAKWKLEELDLPVLIINLDNSLSLEEVSRDNYTTASATILNSDNFSFTEEVLEIKGRGNTSWLNDKKSYKLKFDEKQNLFGMMDGEQKSKHWVIVGNYLDSSLSKNNLAFTLANEVFDNIPYTSKYQNIDLYVNNEYQGVYSIYEHTRVEEGRVDITSEYAVLDTGYLLEYDMLATGVDGIDYFRVNGLPYPFRIDSPSPEDFEDEESYRQQVLYINSYMQSVWNAIKNDDFNTVCKLVDIDSVVDVYLVNELFKNSDVGLSSFYMYKKEGGKLYFGPIWDFDKSCEICLQNNSYTGLLAGIEFDKDEKVLKTSNPIFYTLMENPKFVNLVRNRWSEKQQEVASVITEFSDATLQHTLSYSRNFELWKECSNTSFRQSVINLQNWLLYRTDWLTKNDWEIVFN